MGRLAAAYFAARPVAEGTGASMPHAGEAATTEAALEALVQRGRAAHPGLAVEAEVFAAHLGRGAALASGEAGPAHVEDLYLACAALLGDEAAVEQLRRTNRPVIVGYLRSIDLTEAFVDEVEQRLWDGALVGTAVVPAKLGTYSGQGALAGWVGIAAQRIALMMRRHDLAEERAIDRVTVEAGQLVNDPELAFIKGKLRHEFQGAISRALERLDDRERMIYRLHIVDGLTVETIGRMYSVSHSTVSRWLGKARDMVVAEAQRLLRDEMRLSPAEFDSVAALVVSQLDLSVSRILKKRG